MHIVGEKDFFAVQYRITDDEKLMGYAKIWFGGRSIGSSEDLIYLKGYLFEGLNQIAYSSKLNFDIQSDNKESIYKKLVNQLRGADDVNSQKHLLTFGTFTDDFTAFSFLTGNDINIVWKLNSNKTPFTDLNLQSTDVNYFKINKDVFITNLKTIKGKIIQS
jgi:hypothetical protein